jgi:hypothetical protein
MPSVVVLDQKDFLKAHNDVYFPRHHADQRSEESWRG